MTAKKKAVPPPSDRIKEFLDLVDAVAEQYRAAESERKMEDNRLQDLLHDVEFAETKETQAKADRELRNSRRNRRVQKDRMQEVELINSFFQEGTNRKVLNGMRQLLGNQRKREDYLYGERHYNYRVPKEPEKEIKNG